MLAEPRTLLCMYLATTMQQRSLRNLVHAWLRHGSRLHGVSAWIEHILTFTILLSVVSLILETEPTLWQRYAPVFRLIDHVTVTVFVFEYVLRLWSITEREGYRDPIGGRLKYALTPLMLIDALAILPSLLPLIGFDLRMLRLIRLLRLLKFSRHNEITRMFLRVLRDRTPELVTASLVGLAIVLISSSLMYFIEGERQPDAFGSIPRAMWWAVVTLTTVGYGDVTPITPLGRLVVAVTAVIGIGVIAVPTALLGSGLTEALSERRRRKRHSLRRVSNQNTNK